MLYNLGISQKTVYLSVDEFLNMTDQEYSDMIAFNVGDELPPTWGSILTELSKEREEIITEEDIEIIEENEEDHQLFDQKDLEDLMSNDSFLQD